MASAEIVVNALRDIKDKKELDRYDESLCRDIQQRLDSKLKENNMSISEKSIFARNNFAVMDKWSTVFPTGVSECLREYFRSKAIWSPRFDPRFPNQNQAKNCYVNFVDYQRCKKLKGEDFKDCDYFKQVSDSLCPDQWLEKFNDQLENGTFPADY